MFRFAELGRRPQRTTAISLATLALVPIVSVGKVHAAESHSSKTVRMEAALLGKRIAALWRRAPDAGGQVHVSIFSALPPGADMDASNYTDRRLLVKTTKPDPKTGEPMVYSLGVQMGRSRDGKLMPATTSHVSATKQTAGQAADKENFAGQGIDIDKDDLSSPSKGWMARLITSSPNGEGSFLVTDTFKISYGINGTSVPDRQFNPSVFNSISRRANDIINLAQPDQ